MPESQVRTRFAPSPTGFLHIGNLRTALFNYLLAEHHGGEFVLRSEDTDPERSFEEYLAALTADLRWLGLEWGEGPDHGGPRGPYRQSERAQLYARYFDRLVAVGDAYPCFCSDEQLRLSRKAQLAAGRPPRYAGTCAGIGAEEAAARLAAGEQATLRFRVPRGRQIVFDDLVRGPQRFDTDAIGDFIIRRANDTAAFFFGNAVDDALMEITHVLRGEDHLANTPRQLLLLESLGLKAPRYGHLGLITAADGKPLSKRDGGSSLRELREAGFLPEAVINHLARLGHHYESEQGLGLDALAAGFDLAHLGRSPAQHDLRQLRHWQKVALHGASDGELRAWLAEHQDADGRGFDDYVPEDLGIAFVAAVRDNLVLPVEGLGLAADLFAEELVLSGAAQAAVRGAGSEFFEVALEQLPANEGDFKGLAEAVGKRLDLRGRDLYMPLRAALTNRDRGPEMPRLWPLIDPALVRRRLTTARDLDSS